MTVALKTTFDRLSPTAGALLRLASFLAPAPMQVEMFEEEVGFVQRAAELLAEERGQDPDAGSIGGALAELTTASMITRKKGRRFVVDGLVQEAIRDQIREEKRRDWIHLSLHLVNYFSPFETGDVRTWPVWDLLGPHAAAIVAAADAAGIPEPTDRLMNQLGLWLAAKGRHSEAEPLFRRALAIKEVSLGPDHPDVAGALNNLAHLLQDTGRLDEAEPLVHRVLAIAEASFEPDHPKVAVSLSNLARLLKSTNRLDEAEPLARRALAIDEAAFDPDHPAVAIRLNNLALLLQDLNRPDEAEPLMRRAVAIVEKSLGPDHPQTQKYRRTLSRLLGES